MKRRLVYWIGAALITAQMTSAAAYAEETEEYEYADVITSAVTAQLGGTLTADGTIVSGDLFAVFDQEGSMGASASFSVGEDDSSEQFSWESDDLIRIVGSDIYLNTSGIANAFGVMTGAGDMDYLLSMFGITEDWVQLPMPDFSALNADPENGDASAFSLPDFDMDELLAEATDILTPFFPETAEDGTMTFRVTSDMLLDAASSADSVISKHFGLLSGSSADISSQADALISAFAAYINAVAEGYVSVDSTYSTEEVADMLKTSMVDAVSSYAEMMSESLSSLSDEEGNEISVSSLTEQLLDDHTFDATLEIDSSSMTLNAVFDGNVLVGQADITDTGLVATLGTEDEVVYTAQLAATETGLSLVVFDAEETEILNADVTIDDEQYDFRVFSEETPLLSGTIIVSDTEFGYTITDETSDSVLYYDAVVTDDGLRLQFTMDDSMDVTADLSYISDDAGIDAELVLDGTVDGESIGGSLYLKVYPSEGYVEIPEAADGLEIIRDISAVYFSSQLSEEETE